MSQVVSNNSALFFSIFDKHTEKQNLGWQVVFIQMGIEKIFCFYFLVINVYSGRIMDAFHPYGKLKNG